MDKSIITPDLSSVFIAIYKEFENEGIAISEEFKSELKNDKDIISQITTLKQAGVDDTSIAKFIVRLFTSSSNFQDFKKNFKNALQKLASLLTENKKFDHESFREVVIQEFINLTCAGLDYNTVGSIITDTIRISSDFQTFKGTLFQITATLQALNKQLTQKFPGLKANQKTSETLNILRKRIAKSIVDRLKNKKAPIKKEDLLKALEQAITAELKKIIPETKFNINLVDEVLKAMDKPMLKTNIAPQISQTEIAELSSVKSQTRNNKNPTENSNAINININHPQRNNIKIEQNILLQTQFIEPNVPKPSIVAKQPSQNQNISQSSENNYNKEHTAAQVEKPNYRSPTSSQPIVMPVNLNITTAKPVEAVKILAETPKLAKEISSHPGVNTQPQAELHPQSTPNTKGPEHGQEKQM